MKKLAIIIVNWNTSELLKHCLDSITQNGIGDTPFEILVVDNGSSDDSCDMVRHFFPQICLIENQNNVGFAEANNQAARLISAEFLLLLNSDTVVQSGSTKAMISFLDSHTEAGIVGCQLLNEDGSEQGSFADFPTLTSALLGKDSRRHKKLYDDTPAYEVDAVSGACLMVRKDAWEGVSGMDETYQWFVEEVDLCYRVKRMGWHVCWLPEARITHLLGQSRKLRSMHSYLNVHRSRLLFFRDHYGIFQAHLLRIGYVAVTALKFSVNTILSKISGFKSRAENSNRNKRLLNWLITEQDVLN